MLGQTRPDCLVEKASSDGASLEMIDDADRVWWIKKDGEYDEVITDNELVAIVEVLVERKCS